MIQYLFFIFSGTAFVICGFLFFVMKKSMPVLLSGAKITGIGKPSKFGLPVCVFKNGDWTLFSLPNYPFTLNFRGKNYLKIQFFEENSPICVKKEIQQNACFYGVCGKMHSTELCVKQQNCTVFNKMHSTVRILIQKDRLPFRVGANKDSIKFEDFRLNLFCDGKIELNISEDSLQYVIKNAGKIELDYSSLALTVLSNSENRQIALETFALPVLNFEKPDFSQLYKAGLRGDYVRDCVRNIKFHLTEQPTAHFVNLTELGFSKWTTLRKWGKLLILQDWLTGYTAKIYAGGQTGYLCCWWGEILLCLENDGYAVKSLPFDQIKEGRINLFKYKFNWQFFPRKMQFDFAGAMLKYMNRQDDSRWLADKDIAGFILNCLPKELEMTPPHYNYVRELYPYIVLKPLKCELLLFMQKYEQMFYKNL